MGSQDSSLRDRLGAKERDGCDDGWKLGSDEGCEDGRELGLGVGDGVMGGSGPRDMDIDDVDMHILPYPDLDTFAFGNFALVSLAAFESGDADAKTKTEERRIGAMVSFMMFVVDRFLTA